MLLLNEDEIYVFLFEMPYSAYSTGKCFQAIEPLRDVDTEAIYVVSYFQYFETFAKFAIAESSLIRPFSAVVKLCSRASPPLDNSTTKNLTDISEVCHRRMRDVSRKKRKMSKRNQQDRRMVLGLSGALSTNWAMLGRAVIERGGAPEDLGVLGEPENPVTQKMVDTLATELVALGNATRANRERTALVPPQFAFTCALQPLHLFILNKSGADAVALLSRMDGTYSVTDYGKGMMYAPECTIGPTETTLVGVYTCEQLGVTDWAETDFFGPKGWEHIKQFGLTKCLPDDGPHVRIAHSKQELGEWFRVGHDPIPFGGCSDVWVVGHDDVDGRYLRGWDLRAGLRLAAGPLLALRLA